MDMEFLFTLVFAVILSVYVFNLFFDLRNLFLGNAPHLPSSTRALKNIKEIYTFKPGQRVADFGSGNGRIINKLKNLPVNLVGIELNPFWYFFSKLRFYGNKNVRIIKNDFLKEQLSDYDVIVIYGIDHVVKVIEAKIVADNIKKLAIISNKFKFDKLPLSKNIGDVYLYEI